jgi:hypothetical protein
MYKQVLGEETLSAFEDIWCDFLKIWKPYEDKGGNWWGLLPCTLRLNLKHQECVGVQDIKIDDRKGQKSTRDQDLHYPQTQMLGLAF